MKKFFKVLLLSSSILMLSINVSASVTENQIETRTEIHGIKETLPSDPVVETVEPEQNRIAKFFGATTKTKSATRSYRSVSDIPAAIYVEEFDDKEQSWYSGTLNLKSYNKLGQTTFYEATFSGTLTKMKDW